MTAETTPVEYRVLQIEQVAGAGSLIGLATVEADIAGVAIVLQGVQVRRRTDGTLDCLAPQFRHARNGRWLPCLLLPPELSAAIASEVLAAISSPPASISPNQRPASPRSNLECRR
jgi:hypothetical protein